MEKSPPQPSRASRGACHCHRSSVGKEVPGTRGGRLRHKFPKKEVEKVGINVAESEPRVSEVCNHTRPAGPSPCVAQRRQAKVGKKEEFANNVSAKPKQAMLAVNHVTRNLGVFKKGSPLTSRTKGKPKIVLKFSQSYGQNPNIRKTC